MNILYTRTLIFIIRKRRGHNRSWFYLPHHYTLS